MHPNLEMGISIDYQMQKLVKKYKAELDAIAMDENDPDRLIEMLLTRSLKKMPDYDKKFENQYYIPLASIFLMQKKYRLAWLTYMYLYEDWFMYLTGTDPETRPLVLDLPYWGDLNILWEQFENPEFFIPDPDDGIQQRTYRNPEAAMASPLSEAANQRELDEALQKLKKRDVAAGYYKEWGPDPTALYNMAPAARYAKCVETREFHLSHESLMFETFWYIVRVMANERNLEAAEWLFRLRHILSRRCPPKVDEGSPKLIQIASMTNCLECWLAGRLSLDPGQRRTLGWMAVYWLLENILVSPGMDWNFFWPFHQLCGLIAEFGLFGEDQAEFERHMKVFISMAGKSLARRMLEDPKPVMGLAEMGGIPGREAVAIYRRLAEKIQS